MRTRATRLGVGLVVSVVLVASLLVPAGSSAQTSADPTAPPGSEWLANGGNLANQRYSRLDKITTANVGSLKGAWMTHLGSGLDAKYSLEATPIVHNGLMFVTTGNDNVLALDARSGAVVWQYDPEIDQKITTVCCGWANRGLALGDGRVYEGLLDGTVLALDERTGAPAWRIELCQWEQGCTITAAPAFYNGTLYVGISGGEYGIRGRLTALNAATGAEVWRFYTIPAPGEIGGDTWPADSDAYEHGGASIWQTPAIDPDLGLIYFSTGNAGPDDDGSVRPGDNLFSSSIVALHLDGTYAWHFQEVHHDIWDYDAPSPVVLFDIGVGGQTRKALAQPSKTGWVYILDRATGQPLIGIDEKPVPQEPQQATAATQPYPRGDAFVPQCGVPVPGYPLTGCIFSPYTDVPVVIQPRASGGSEWSPSAFSPQTGFLYVSGVVQDGAFTQHGPGKDTLYDAETIAAGRAYRGSDFTGALVGATLNGTFSAMDMRTNTIAWQVKKNFALKADGALTTAGGLVFVGMPDGNLEAYDARTGNLLWQFQTGAGASAPPITYEVDGVQYVAIAAGGSALGAAARGDMVWSFRLDGSLGPLAAPTPPPSVVTFPGPLVQTTSVGVEEYGFAPPRISVPAGSTVTWTNTGDLAHSATDEGHTWDTDLIPAGGSASVTFDTPGTYTYVCQPHPWMVAQLVVTEAPAGPDQ